MSIDDISKTKDKYSVRYKSLEVKDEQMKRFRDSTQVDLTYEDSLNTALVITSELQKPKEYKWIKDMIDAEEKLRNNPVFKSLFEISESMKKAMKPSPMVEEMIKQQKKASQLFYKNNESLLTQADDIRKTALGITGTEYNANLTKIKNILGDGILEIGKKIEFHHNEAEKCQEQIQHIDEQVEVETKKMEMAHHRDEMIRLSAVVQQVDPMYVSQFMKDSYRQDMKPFEIPTSKKAGKKYS